MWNAYTSKWIHLNSKDYPLPVFLPTTRFLVTQNQEHKSWAWELPGPHHSTCRSLQVTLIPSLQLLSNPASPGRCSLPFAIIFTNGRSHSFPEHPWTTYVSYSRCLCKHRLEHHIFLFAIGRWYLCFVYSLVILNVRISFVEWMNLAILTLTCFSLPEGEILEFFFPATKNWSTVPLLSLATF